MIPLAPNQIRLSSKDRRILAWSNKPERRHAHIPNYSTLPRVDRRQHKCESCNKLFNNTDLLKRHAQITHTGTKPVVCEICERRFSTERHMLAHYNIHNEPRLEEFNVLMKRTYRPVKSLPSSFTTIGSYGGVPKALKTYASEPTFTSFGTRQSFLVSSKNDDVKPTEAQDDDAVYNYNKMDDTDVKRFMDDGRNGRHVKSELPKSRSARRVQFSATSRRYSDLSSTSDVIRQVREAQTVQRTPSRRRKGKPLSGQVTTDLSHTRRFSSTTFKCENTDLRERPESLVKLPSVSASRKSPTKTNGSQNWTKTKEFEKTEDLREALPSLERDGVMPCRTSTPKSLNTRSSYSELPRHLGSVQFADDQTGCNYSSPARRMSAITSVSGYDPYRNKIPKRSALQSVKSE